MIKLLKLAVEYAQIILASCKYRNSVTKFSNILQRHNQLLLFKIYYSFFHNWIWQKREKTQFQSYYLIRLVELELILSVNCVKFVNIVNIVNIVNYA